MSWSVSSHSASSQEDLGDVAGHNEQIGLGRDQHFGCAFHPLHPLGTWLTTRVSQHGTGWINTDDGTAVYHRQLSGKQACATAQIQDGAGIEFRQQAGRKSLCLRREDFQCRTGLPGASST